MPTKAGTNCTKPGCNGVIRKGVCSGCGPQRTWRDRVHDRERGSAHERGYNSTWRKLRIMQLNSEPLCHDCLAGGMVVAATEVHHIKAVRDGGSNEFNNLMSLCKGCHSKRTMRGE